MSDANNAARVRKAALEIWNGPHRNKLRFRDKDMSTRAMLLLRPDGSPSLSLRDKDRKTRAILRLRPDGSPGLTLSDAKGDVIWQVPPKK